jgi:hypothetical protein
MEKPIAPGPPGTTREPAFCLEAPPDRLWSLERMAREFDVRESSIRRWVRDGKIPQPWTRRSGKPLWAPEVVRPALLRHRHGVCG